MKKYLPYACIVAGSFIAGALIRHNLPWVAVFIAYVFGLSLGAISLKSEKKNDE